MKFTHPGILDVLQADKLRSRAGHQKARSRGIVCV
mgnify:CR=1 FL=1